MFLLLFKVLLKQSFKCDSRFNYACNYWSQHKETYEVNAKMQVEK